MYLVHPYMNQSMVPHRTSPVKNIANPMSMILSVAMMLRQSFQLHEEAAALEKAASEVMNAGFLTADLGGIDDNDSIY